MIPKCWTWLILYKSVIRLDRHGSWLTRSFHLLRVLHSLRIWQTCCLLGLRHAPIVELVEEFLHRDPIWQADVLDQTRWDVGRSLCWPRLHILLIQDETHPPHPSIGLVWLGTMGRVLRNLLIDVAINVLLVGHNCTVSILRLSPEYFAIVHTVWE